jgi:hypothetical protein
LIIAFMLEPAKLQMNWAKAGRNQRPAQCLRPFTGCVLSHPTPASNPRRDQLFPTAGQRAGTATVRTSPTTGDRVTTRKIEAGDHERTRRRPHHPGGPPARHVHIGQDRHMATASHHRHRRRRPRPAATSGPTYQRAQRVVGGQPFRGMHDRRRQLRHVGMGGGLITAPSNRAPRVGRAHPAEVMTGRPANAELCAHRHARSKPTEQTDRAKLGFP